MLIHLLVGIVSSMMQQQHPAQVVQRVRTAFQLGRTRKLQFREGQLRAFLRLLDENETSLLDAVYADLRKPPQETSLCELDLVRNEVLHALHNAWDWSKPEVIGKSFVNMLDTVQIRKDPYGVVLIMSSWSCPLLLLLRPFVGALAAGNCVILHPNNKAYTTAMLIAELIGKYLDNECYQVFTGNASETEELLLQHFDYVFYTGGMDKAKQIRDLTNRHLTPTRLELAGKCPVFIDDNVNLNMAAKRIMLGKLINAGQTSSAADFLLCSKSIEEPLVAALHNAVMVLLGSNPQTSSYYARIINDVQYERLVHLMAGTTVALGGKCDPYERYIEPTVLTNVTAEDPIMCEEIFGPLLPIVNINGPDEAVEFITRRAKPLAVYVFSNTKSTIDKFLHGTSSDFVVINDAGIQVGLGSSGGKSTFDNFTHHKTCIIKDLSAINERLNSLRYPPYSPRHVSFLRMINKPRNYPSMAWMKNYLIFCLGVAVAAAYYYYSK